MNQTQQLKQNPADLLPGVDSHAGVKGRVHEESVDFIGQVDCQLVRDFYLFGEQRARRLDSRSLGALDSLCVKNFRDFSRFLNLLLSAFLEVSTLLATELPVSCPCRSGPRSG